MYLHLTIKIAILFLLLIAPDLVKAKDKNLLGEYKEPSLKIKKSTSQILIGRLIDNIEFHKKLKFFHESSSLNLQRLEKSILQKKVKQSNQTALIRVISDSSFEVTSKVLREENPALLAISDGLKFNFFLLGNKETAKKSNPDPVKYGLIVDKISIIKKRDGTTQRQTHYSIGQLQNKSQTHQDNLKSDAGTISGRLNGRVETSTAENLATKRQLNLFITQEQGLYELALMNFTSSKDNQLKHTIAIPLGHSRRWQQILDHQFSHLESNMINLTDASAGSRINVRLNHQNKSILPEWIVEKHQTKTRVSIQIEKNMHPQIYQFAVEKSL
tara:strand:- start:306 stop:1292 length:987 start_codon:yes stop_codon:yes gene_type:complete